MIREAALALLISLATLALTRVAHAESHAGSVAVVRVYVAGPPEAVMRARATLRELFARIGVEPVVEPASSEDVLNAASSDSAPRAFLDFRAPSAPRVILIQRPSGRELERRTLPGSASLEVSVEEASHVLYMAMQSVLRAPDGATSSSGAESPANAAAGAAPAEAAPPAEPPTTASTPAAADEKPVSGAPPLPRPTDAPLARPDDSRPGERGPSSAPLAFDAGLSAFGAVSSFAAAHVLPGVGAALDAALGDARVRPVAVLSAGVFFPSPVTIDGQSGSLRAEAIRLTILAEWRPWPRAGFVAGAGGGVDRVTFDGGQSTSAALSSGVTTRVDPILGGMLGARFRISSAFAAFALAALDVDLTPHRYESDENGVPASYFTLPRARPTALLGFSYVFHAGAGETRQGAR